MLIQPLYFIASGEGKVFGFLGTKLGSLIVLVINPSRRPYRYLRSRTYCCHCKGVYEYIRAVLAYGHSSRAEQVFWTEPDGERDARLELLLTTTLTADGLSLA